MNAIRVVSVILFAFLFMLVITTRKREKNDTSVLLCILTNYLQLIAAAMSFNLKFPDTLSRMFNPITRIGLASGTFWLFNWFVEDIEIKAFAPSVEIFKVFLTGVLLLVLISIYCLIWLVLYLINRKLFNNVKRHFVVSVICTISLLHLTITKSTFGLFECLKIEDNTFRVITYMEYECYLVDHMKWIMMVSLPNLLIWVICWPVVAFVILFTNGSKLDNDSIK